MKLFIKLLCFLLLFVNINFVFAENVGLSTYGLDLFNPNDEAVDYSDTSSNSSVSLFLGGKVGSIVNIILGFSSLIVFILVIYGGIVILTSSGKAKSYEKGLNLIKTTFIGLLIIIFSYAIVSFLVKNISKNTINSEAFLDNNSFPQDIKYV